MYYSIKIPTAARPLTDITIIYLIAELPLPRNPNHAGIPITLNANHVSRDAGALSSCCRNVGDQLGDLANGNSLSL